MTSAGKRTKRDPEQSLKQTEKKGRSKDLALSTATFAAQQSRPSEQGLQTRTACPQVRARVMTLSMKIRIMGQGNWHATSGGGSIWPTWLGCLPALQPESDLLGPAAA